MILGVRSYLVRRNAARTDRPSLRRRPVAVCPMCDADGVHADADACLLALRAEATAYHGRLAVMPRARFAPLWTAYLQRLTETQAVSR